MSVNIPKLKGKIVEAGMTAEEVAKRIGIDTSTFSRKISGGGNKFTVEQMQKMYSILHLTESEAYSIFFAD